jgi:polyisoprenyl-phosphate glycosyltransferase
MSTVSAIVPVFNAEQTLHALHRELVAVLERSTEAFEIILVEDGGRDNSWTIIAEIAARDERVQAYASAEILASTTRCCAASGMRATTSS